MNDSRLKEIERIAKGRMAVVEGHGSLAVSERIIVECVAEIKRLRTYRLVCSTPLLSIHLPALPDKDLLTNARDGRLSKWERASAVKSMKKQWTPYFNSALQCIRFRQGQDGPRLFLAWTLYVESYKSPDDDGWTAALKPIRDLLREIGVFWGDGPKYIGGSAPFIEVDKAKANTGRLDVWEYAEVKARMQGVSQFGVVERDALALVKGGAPAGPMCPGQTTGAANAKTFIIADAQGGE